METSKFTSTTIVETVPTAVKEYQCPGCVSGGECFEKDPCSEACDKHHAGTLLCGIGKLFLGLPNGFNRLGECNTKIQIFNTFGQLKDLWSYDKFNVPVWKHLNECNHTIIRGISPRINCPFIHIVLENCMDKVNCLEITSKNIEEMD
jgi:hypothetical protein